jgi:hypothetical protein
MGRIARLSVARSTQKGALSPVVQAHGTMKWSLSGVSRQSLEQEFSEVHIKDSGSWFIVDSSLVAMMAART